MPTPIRHILIRSALVAILTALILAASAAVYTPKANAHPGSHRNHTVKVCLAKHEDSPMGKCPKLVRDYPALADYRNGAWWVTPEMHWVIKHIR